jgi:hypothetical protein
MPSISPIIAHIFDDPHGKRRVKREDANRDRFASKVRIPRRRGRN